MFNPLSLLGNVIDGVGGYFSKGQEIKQEITQAKNALELAKINSQVKILEAETNHKIKSENIEQQETFNLDKQAVDNMKEDWKDDIFAVFFFTVLFGTLIVALAFPTYLGHWIAGLHSLGEIPMILQVGIGLMFVHVYGFRNLLRMYLKGKYKLKGFDGTDSYEISESRRLHRTGHRTSEQSTNQRPNTKKQPDEDASHAVDKIVDLSKEIPWFKE